MDHHDELEDGTFVSTEEECARLATRLRRRYIVNHSRRFFGGLTVPTLQPKPRTEK